MRAEIARAYFVSVRFENNSCLLSSLLYNSFLTLANRQIRQSLSHNNAISKLFKR